jgi:hypothetical protein
MELLDRPEQLGGILAEGAERAHKVAGETLHAVYERVGFFSTGS